MATTNTTPAASWMDTERGISPSGRFTTIHTGAVWADRQTAFWLFDAEEVTELEARAMEAKTRVERRERNLKLLEKMTQY